MENLKENYQWCAQCKLWDLNTVRSSLTMVELKSLYFVRHVYFRVCRVCMQQY